VPNLPIPASEHLTPSNARSESTNNGITFAMAAVAIVLMAVYFAISVLSISR